MAVNVPPHFWIVMDALHRSAGGDMLFIRQETSAATGKHRQETWAKASRTCSAFARILGSYGSFVDGCRSDCNSITARGIQ